MVVVVADMVIAAAIAVSEAVTVAVEVTVTATSVVGVILSNSRVKLAAKQT